MLAPLDFFERLPAADFAIVHPVKVVSLRDLHHAESLCVVARNAPRAPAAVNPSTPFRGQCCALTICALTGSAPSLRAEPAASALRSPL